MSATKKNDLFVTPEDLRLFRRERVTGHEPGIGMGWHGEVPLAVIGNAYTKPSGGRRYDFELRPIAVEADGSLRLLPVGGAFLQLWPSLGGRWPLARRRAQDITRLLPAALSVAREARKVGLPPQFLNVSLALQDDLTDYQQSVATYAGVLAVVAEFPQVWDRVLR